MKRRRNLEGSWKSFRDFNAVPFLAYWDIYKNYYSNKQESAGYFIHSDPTLVAASTTPIAATLKSSGGSYVNCLTIPVAATPGDIVTIQFPANCPELTNPSTIGILLNAANNTLVACADAISWNESLKQVTATLNGNVAGKTFAVREIAHSSIAVLESLFGLQSFPLSAIDDMRDNILRYASAGAFKITSASPLPYSAPMKVASGSGATLKYAVRYSQNALGIKTYQSDLHNNWVNTAWITGAGSIAALTAVNTGAGSFTIDALNLAEKVYNMLNRIAISGGTYDDWLDAVYTHERIKGVESPVYHGSLIKELAFQEVISNHRQCIQITIS